MTGSCLSPTVTTNWHGGTVCLKLLVVTYLTFHFRFLVPLIAILLVAYEWPSQPIDQFAPSRAIPLVRVIALIYATHWDNYLVA